MNDHVGGVCSVPTCEKPLRRGQALCRKHWMAIGHWHRTQIGNAMRDEKDVGTGPDESGAYHGEEYLTAVRDAVMSLEHITTRRTDY